VPAHGGPDYVRNLYEGSRTDKKGVFSYHTKKYGPLDKFGYKDFIPMFTAPKFNADDWVDLMHEAGARFGGICLVHHDGFLLWDSKVNRWNSANMGPKRDIFGEIAAAVRKYDGMKLLATFHHGRSFGYCTGAMKKEDITDEMRKTWDVFDPQYADFYWNEETGTAASEFSEQWRAKVTEVIDNYRPDMIWFDGLRTSMRNGHPPESYVREVIAHYYDNARANKQDVTVCNKHGGEFNFPESFGLRCFENGRDMPTDIGPWFLIDRAMELCQQQEIPGRSGLPCSQYYRCRQPGWHLSVIADAQGRWFDPRRRTEDHAWNWAVDEGQWRSDLRHSPLEDPCRRPNSPA